MTTQTQYLVTSMHEWLIINNEVIPNHSWLLMLLAIVVAVLQFQSKMLCLCFLIPHFTHLTGQVEKRHYCLQLANVHFEGAYMFSLADD